MTNQNSFEAGYSAAVNGDRRAPAICSIYMGLIADELVGGRGADLARDWLAGYDRQVDELCAKLMAS